MRTVQLPSLTFRATRVRLTVAPLTLMRWSIAACYLWFGAMKFLPGLSPAESLATLTIDRLTFGLVTGRMAIISLALMECAIGLALLTRIARRPALHLLLFHMLCTFAPAILFPELVFTHVPYGLTLLGQYLVKNLVITTAAWTLLRSTTDPRP